MRLKRKRHPITLLEIMIVILLIGVIGGVLSYNLKGTLERGKIFRTEEGKKRLKEIVELQIETGGSSLAEFRGVSDSFSPIVKECVSKSKFISPQNLEAFLKDGWNEPYIITIVNEELRISSYRYDQLKPQK
jgi:type II secretory pathway pseudopilin PulG